ncbi:hypothetical protein CDEF62S_03420 [Castellaniella defragrans]
MDSKLHLVTFLWESWSGEPRQFLRACSSSESPARWCFQLSSPTQVRSTACWNRVAVFALGFVAQPLGALFFLPVQRYYGRAAKLTLALFILGSATVGVAFLPSYAAIGGLREPSSGAAASPCKRATAWCSAIWPLRCG